MAQLKDLIVNGPSRFIGDVYATTFTGDLNGNANTATSANTAAALTGKTLVTASSVTTSNWPTYADNYIPTMSFMAHWNGAYSGTSSNLTYCAQGAIIGSNNIGNQSVKYATTSGTCSGNAATAGSATSADYANEIARKSMLDSQEKIDNFITANRLEYATFKTTDANNVDFAGNDGMILSIPWTSTSYGAQIAFDDTTSGTVKVRGKSNTWGNWYTLLHSGNYTSYTVKKDGTGAIGTWGISISGNAGTSNRAKFLETFQQNSTTNTYGSQYPIWAQWSDATNVRLQCTNYTVWTDKATYATTAGSAPASDVKAWAKADNKPSYTGTEVTLTTDYTSSPYKAIEPGDSVQAAIAKLEGTISGLEALLASI